MPQQQSDNSTARLFLPLPPAHAWPLLTYAMLEQSDYGNSLAVASSWQRRRPSSCSDHGRAWEQGLNYAVGLPTARPPGGGGYRQRTFILLDHVFATSRVPSKAYNM